MIQIKRHSVHKAFLYTNQSSATLCLHITISNLTQLLNQSRLPTRILCQLLIPFPFHTRDRPKHITFGKQMGIDRLAIDIDSIHVIERFVGNLISPTTQITETKTFPANSTARSLRIRSAICSLLLTTIHAGPEFNPGMPTRARTLLNSVTALSNCPASL